MLLSIIIPVYNSENYIEQCLESCILQGIDKKEYEIICVDDGSTDSSRDILARIGNDQMNVIVLHKQNGGVSSARNLGLSLAKGRYIWFIDSDDFISKKTLFQIKETIEGNNQVDIIEIGAEQFCCETEIENFRKYTKPHSSWLWGHIFRRELIFDKNIRFRENIEFAEDMLFEFEIHHLNPNIVVQKIEEVSYYYRDNNKGLSKRVGPKRIESYINLAEIMRGYMIEGESDSNLAEYYTVLYYYRALNSIIRIPGIDQKEFVKKLSSIGYFKPSQSVLSRLAITHPGIEQENFKWGSTRYGFFIVKLLFYKKRIERKMSNITAFCKAKS